MENNTVVMGDQRLTIEQVMRVARGEAKVALSGRAEFQQTIARGAQFLDDLWQREGVIYGVTTGYGDSCTVTVPSHLVEELPLHLSRYHGCGMGNILSLELAKAVLVTRLTSLCQGYSGVTLALLQRIECFINDNVIPVIPEEGSVGASGDLTPLSYLAAALVGEREVFFNGKRQASAQALAALGLAPLKLRPKEGLALMNGTAVMTALACQAYQRAEYLTRLSARITAMMSTALLGNANHFDAALFAAKPHPGQADVAGWIRGDLSPQFAGHNSSRLQDRYSIRCAPHVIGVLADSLPWMRSFIENELNSANDNPLINVDSEQVMHGGHFYGGHIAFVMDSLKNCVANLADLLDRQMALLLDPKFNHGLPANLSGATDERAPINHGFKAVQIAVSAWTAEALKLTMPASVFSRSTECHNQDKVSMGTIAARDCLRVLELTEQVTAAVLLAASQGLELRQRQEELAEEAMTDSLVAMQSQVFAAFEFLEEDRPLEGTLRQFVALIQNRHWDLYPNG
ncbi:aromatic amino acid ammonia-lyase [Halioxenophilus sp. WMMB6]|uniref:HAL/PAL/TAL family ammonia-lyase n=1 Tax=Halioxenophilus sp. WMMB6 TaxID=3073815 RepID=UPI00295F38D3|nr:aromatic amino acid ammonia-lyase [Halioxenophilus sp. WMMB6]